MEDLSNSNLKLIQILKTQISPHRNKTKILTIKTQIFQERDRHSTHLQQNLTKSNQTLLYSTTPRTKQNWKKPRTTRRRKPTSPRPSWATSVPQRRFSSQTRRGRWSKWKYLNGSARPSAPALISTASTPATQSKTPMRSWCHTRTRLVI